jgi:ATP-binding cassette, subfamily B, bacterial MsbA
VTDSPIGKPPGRSIPGGKAATATKTSAVQLDARMRELLMRFGRTWVFGRWRELLMAFVLMSIVAATTGAYPLIIKHSYDMLTRGAPGILHLVLGAIVGTTALRAIFMYMTSVQTNRIVMRTTTDIQKAAFAHLIAADYDRLARDAPGQLVSRLTNDVTLIQQAAQATLNSAVRDILYCIALVCSMLYLDWVMSMIVLGIYPLAAWPILQIGQRLRRVAKLTQAELGDMTAALTENLSGARLIKTYGLEDYAKDRINGSFEEIYRLRMKAVKARARLDPILEVLGGIAVAGVIAFAYWRIVSGKSTVGDFMGFVSALLMAAQPIRALGNLNSKVQEGLAALARVFEILDEKAKIVDRPGAKPLVVTAGSIDFDRVGFDYAPADSSGLSEAGAAPSGFAVRDVTLTIPGGRTVALVGRSGAGKSTLMNLVPRLFEPQTGAIRVDDQDIAQVTVTSLRDKIAIVSQDITLFNDTVRANIALGRLGASDADIEAAARAAAAHEFIAALPNGYATEIGERGLRLSGGQRQRLALARAILRSAPILLLDEATSALDTESERAVQAALADFSRNRTTLVIAHRLSTVQGADLICVMDDGRIVETGRHDVLLAKGGIYASLCRQQLLPAPPQAAQVAAQ